ncbi:MAG: RodZ domain-containing protein [Idiomarina sp.]
MTAEQENPEQNNNENEVSTPPPASGPTPGELLRAARMKRNLELRDIADRLRLRLQIIELIEEDDYETFNSATFVRGYLRSYAKALELNEVDVLAAYDRMGYEEPVSIDMQSFSRRKAHQENDNRLMFVSYAILVLVIGLAFIWWWQEPDFQFGADNGDAEAVSSNSSRTNAAMRPDELQDAADETAAAAQRSRADSAEPLREEEVSSADVSTALSSTHPEPAAEASGADVEEITQVPVESEPEANESGPEPETNEPEQSEPVESAPQRATTPANEPAAQATASESTETTTAELVLLFGGDCWVKVEDATGETIAFGVKPAGYEMPLEGEAPYSITLGAPEVVSIRFRGEAVDMSQFRSGRAASFTLPQ